MDVTENWKLDLIIIFIFPDIYSCYGSVLRFVKIRNFQYNEKKYYFCTVKQGKTYGNFCTPHRGIPVYSRFFSLFSQKKHIGESPKTPMFSTCSAGFTTFTFTGKERDEETGYGYFGARYMDHELMTMWLSVDPMPDKYPSISPYAYCAWNPVKLVDPDGRKIIIKDGNKSYYYINGHVYSNENGHGLQFDSELGKEASKIKNNLDEMRKDNAGAKVVGRLIKSEETYTIAADAKTGDGSYRASSNKVSLVSGKLNNMESLSHELFHAYQDDNGRIPHTVYNEVEAYIFSGMMSGKPTMGMMSDKNPEYTKHANNLKKGFSNRSFNYLVSHFRRDSKANTLRGTYKSYEYNPGKYTISQSLLRNLYK